MTHARSDLRDAFGEALGAFGQGQDGEPEPKVDAGDGMIPISKVCSLLWDCTDTLTGRIRDEMKALPGVDEDQLRNTYGSAARAFAAVIKHTKATRATARR